MPTKILLPALAAFLLPGLLAADEHWEERPLETDIPIAMPRNGPLTEAEEEMARIAWRYFENNFQPETGFVNSTHNYPSVTLWDTGSYLAGLVAAHEFGLVEDEEVETRLGHLFTTLSNILLFRDECPNKAYNTETARPVGYTNQPGEIGCSAIDIGRILIWLRAIQQRYPEFTEDADRIVSRWNFCGLVQPPGVLYGTAVAEGGETLYLQEGRLGYEEYAAKGFELWGFDLPEAIAPDPYAAIWLYGVEVPYDTRDPRVLGGHNYVVTESYALDGIEFGWDYFGGPEEAMEDWLPRFAQNIYEAQARRHEATGIVTARTEHQLEEAPFFVYDTIFTDGRPWGTMTETGEFVPRYSAVALKGALGLWALWETEYTDTLFDFIAEAYDPERGFYEGLYEDGRGPVATQTSNNNGIMLETLLFKTAGPILDEIEDRTAWTEAVTEPFRERRCLPE